MLSNATISLSGNCLVEERFISDSMLQNSCISWDESCPNITIGNKAARHYQG